jgi:uncharacterized protein with von Willebrand factor type A (vWA) domain
MTSGTAPGPSPSLEARLLDFARRLRGARVPVSMVEVLDAIACLRHIDLADRAQFRSALAATMVKRATDQAPFDALFEVCFPVLPSRGAQAVGAGPRQDGIGGAGAPGDGAAEGGDGDGNGDGERAAPGAELLAALLDALRHGDEAALRALAGLAVERFSGVEAQPNASERYYLYRVLRQLELYRLVQLAMAAGDGGDEAPDRERLTEQVDRFRRLLAEQVRQRMAGREAVGDGAADFFTDQLDEVDFLRANTSQRRELREAVRPLARKLAARVAAKRRRRRRGRLDVRRTVRRSLSTGGVPVDPAFRALRASKPDLWVLADVSGSVVEFAEFTLSLLHALDAELARLRAFAFVDGVDEVTDLLDDGAGRLDLRSTFARAKVVDADGHSDYGAVFERFLDRYGGDVGPRSTVLVMGDARGNYRDPGLPALRALRARARRLYWLNPEPRAEWNGFDSVMSLYAPTCDRVFEVRNLRQLTDCVLEIT